MASCVYLSVPVSAEANLSFVEPGRRWAHSPSASKAPGISYQDTMKTWWGAANGLLVFAVVRRLHYPYVVVVELTGSPVGVVTVTGTSLGGGFANWTIRMKYVTSSPNI